MKRRLGLAAALTASVLLMAGCAAESSPGPATPASTPEPQQTAQGEYELEAAWLDDGRMFALVTWGSSGCVPSVESAEAQGQTVTVTFVEEDSDRACTADYAPRATLVDLPEGVDPTEEIEIVLIDPVLGDRSVSTDLDGEDDLGSRGGESTDYAPSAGWFDDRGLVLLTWGSSSCVPRVAQIEETEDAATVTFTAEDGACTRDMAPRATVLMFEDDHDDDDFVLTLTGGEFDGVEVRPIDN